MVLFAAKVYASVRSGSLAIIASTLDSLLDLLSGYILWFTAFSMQTPNPYRNPIGKGVCSRCWVLFFHNLYFQKWWLMLTSRSVVQNVLYSFLRKWLTCLLRNLNYCLCILNRMSIAFHLSEANNKDLNWQEINELTQHCVLTTQ
jgi:hypothetical protein